jgi:hypothetical protein
VFAIVNLQNVAKLNTVSVDGNMSYKFKILSIDGGGIRGIIPAKILAEIEKRTGKRMDGYNRFLILRWMVQVKR